MNKFPYKHLYGYSFHFSYRRVRDGVFQKKESIVIVLRNDDPRVLDLYKTIIDDMECGFIRGFIVRPIYKDSKYYKELYK